MATNRAFNVRHGLSAGSGGSLKSVIRNDGTVLDLGGLSALNTTDKTSAVNAINELKSGLDNINTVISETSEPMGFPSRTTSSISFNDSTKTFTISPTGAEFSVWTKGVKRTYSASQSVTLAGGAPPTGLYYIYFNASGTLSYRTTYFDWNNDTMVAYVYWNKNTQTAPFVADERHGIVLDWATHEYLHRTRGAVIAEGFSISNYTTEGDGSVNADAQFDIGNGTFFDEDLEVNITHSATPTVGTFTQVLQGAAEIPVFYLSGGSDGLWIKDTATEFAAKQSATTLQYNLLSQGWSTASANDNRHVISWIVATNDITNPIIAILGQDEYSNVGSAIEASFDDLILTNFPIVEFRPLWKVIFKTSSSFTNTPKAYVTDVIDLRDRASSGTASGGTGVSDHGLLSGLTDDDHTNYLHVNTSRANVTADISTSGTLATTNTSDTSLQTSGGAYVAGKLSVDKTVNASVFSNPKTITHNSAVPDNHNAFTIGPITIQEGVSITVGENSSWEVIYPGAEQQEALVSGVNIKTVNGVSILGSGDIPLSTNLSLNGTNLQYTNIDGTLQTIDLAGFLDDTNLVTSVNGSTGDITVQATLVSGTNIKTINSTSLLGSGDIDVQPTLVSGTNIKTVNSTSLLGDGDLAVQATLVSGTNIKTVNSTSLLGSGDLAVQATLVSGTNIKTVNSTSLLGSGDLAVQATLVSGTNIKTVNSTSLLGSGDIDVQPTLVSGTNIKTVNGNSLLGSGDITVSGGGGIDENLAIAYAIAL